MNENPERRQVGHRGEAPKSDGSALAGFIGAKQVNSRRELPLARDLPPNRSADREGASPRNSRRCTSGCAAEVDSQRAFLRSGPFRSQLLVALTGYSDAGARQRSQEAGFDHHLVKPVNVDALLDLLKADLV